MSLNTKSALKSAEEISDFIKSNDFKSLQMQVKMDSQPTQTPSSDVFYYARDLEAILISMEENIKKYFNSSNENASVLEKLGIGFNKAKRNYEKALLEAKEDRDYLKRYCYFLNTGSEA